MAISESDIADLWFLVRKSTLLMDRGGDAMLHQELGISLAQYLVLSIVDAHPGSFNQQSVADLLGLTKGTVSRQIEIARNAGWLTTTISATSRREKIVALTPAGTDMVRRGDALFAASPKAAFSLLDPADLQVTLRTLTVFVNALGGENRKPSQHQARHASLQPGTAEGRVEGSPGTAA